MKSITSYCFYVAAISLIAGRGGTQSPHPNISDTYNIDICSGRFFNNNQFLRISNSDVILRGINSIGDTTRITYQASDKIASQLVQDAKDVRDYYDTVSKNNLYVTDSQVVAYNHCPKICINITVGITNGRSVGNIDTCYPYFHKYIEFAKEMDLLLNTAHLNILPFDKY
ncbi:MAG TPA: hypothetical protein VFA55_05300 [Candidatus Kapabacteria bacterium]|nr:hypothetical protein [Candidatus Kapabacteria bacterium]